MQAWSEERYRYRKRRLLGFGRARRDFCRRHWDVRGDAVEFGLFLQAILGQRSFGHMDRHGQPKEGGHDERRQRNVFMTSEAELPNGLRCQRFRMLVPAE